MLKFRESILQLKAKISIHVESNKDGLKQLV